MIYDIKCWIQAFLSCCLKVFFFGLIVEQISIPIDPGQINSTTEVTLTNFDCNSIFLPHTALQNCYSYLSQYQLGQGIHRYQKNRSSIPKLKKNHTIFEKKSLFEQTFVINNEKQHMNSNLMYSGYPNIQLSSTYIVLDCLAVIRHKEIQIILFELP